MVIWACFLFRNTISCLPVSANFDAQELSVEFAKFMQSSTSLLNLPQTTKQANIAMLHQIQLHPPLLHQMLSITSWSSRCYWGIKCRLFPGFSPGLSLPVLTPVGQECQAHLHSILCKLCLEDRKWETMGHTAVITHTEILAPNDQKRQGILTSCHPDSQHSMSSPWDIYHELLFCWMTGKCTGQLSATGKPWEKY